MRLLMCRKSRFILLLSSLLLLLLSKEAAAINVGEKAPKILFDELKRQSEQSYTDAKVIYLDFWASWCAPCRLSFPWMNEMQTKYGENGLSIVAVNVDADPSDAKDFLTKTSPIFTVLFDPKGSIPSQYAIRGMPSTFILSKDHTVIASHVGFRESDKGKLEQLIQNALGLKDQGGQ